MSILMAGFNPCFIGNCSHTKIRSSKKEETKAVSILVLLETALIPAEWGRPGAAGGVSILVLLETALIP